MGGCNVGHDRLGHSTSGLGIDLSCAIASGHDVWWWHTRDNRLRCGGWLRECHDGLRCLHVLVLLGIYIPCMARYERYVIGITHSNAQKT